MMSLGEKDPSKYELKLPNQTVKISELADVAKITGEAAKVYNAYADPVDGFAFHEFNPGDGSAAMLEYIEEMRRYMCDGDDAETGQGLIWKFPVGDDTDNIKVLASAASLGVTICACVS